MISTLLSISLVSSLLSCSPKVQQNGLERFCDGAVDGHKDDELPYIQMDVHIPHTEDFTVKRTILETFVEDLDSYTCRLTTQYDESTRACFGFLRLAVVDHETLTISGNLPQVKSLDQLIPLWIENERDVHIYLAGRLGHYEKEFKTTLQQDRMELIEREGARIVDNELLHKLQKQIKARELIRYWLRVGEVVYNINDRFEKFSDLEDFKGQNALVQYLAREVANLPEKDSPVFRTLLVDYFLKQHGFRNMLKEELEFVEEMAEEVNKIKEAQRAEEKLKQEAAKAVFETAAGEVKEAAGDAAAVAGG